MLKNDLEDGYIVEIKWTNLGLERYIKLGEDLVGLTGNIKLYALENDLTINQGLNNVSKVTKVFKNHCMEYLDDIKTDDCLTLIWERQRNKVSFSEAFKAYEQGKEIESCVSGWKYKIVEEIVKIDTDENGIRTYDIDEPNFSTIEINEKWYIN